MSDSFKAQNKEKPKAMEIKIGDVYEITMTQENGIIPKEGDSSRNKYFIVLGFDNAGFVYGGVIINSRINKNLPAHLKMYHMPILQSKYTFLRYNSFVDCVSLKTAHIKNFTEKNFLGRIDDFDLGLIIGTVKESPVMSEAQLSRFGL